MRKVASLEVYQNINRDIIINDTNEEYGCIVLDECMAEKLCKYILEVAKEIREEK